MKIVVYTISLRDKEKGKSKKMGIQYRHKNFYKKTVLEGFLARIFVVFGQLFAEMFCCL